jgi:type IV pilus assembly protein PilC
MAVFAYRVARPDGSTLEGHIEGEEEPLVRAKLEGQGYLIFQLKRRGLAPSRPMVDLSALRGLPIGEFLIFNQELLALVKAGLPVLRVWDLLIERAKHEGFQQALRMVRQDIRGGASASEALSRHPGYFSELYVATIRAGEQSGNLVEVLKRFIAYLKLMIGLRHKIAKALAYPAFLVLTGIAVVGFLLSYVMPTFISVYAETAKSLPVATQLLIDVASAAKVYVLPVLGLLIGVLVIVRMYYATPHGRLSIDRLLLLTPVLGAVFIKHHTIQLARTLGTILAGGTPLVEALHITKSAVSNRYIAAGLSDAVDEIREGTTLAAALDRPKVFPRLAIEMLSVGEETGSLEGMLHDVAEFYEADLDLRLTQLTTWIEPVLLLVMGVLVGGIVIVMYLPVFQMAGNV